jgi:DNA-binding transcriptional LysR family regulator
MLLNNINLKSIHFFVVVAENLSFRKAAEILCRSQSAVSTQVRVLESQLSITLFHRTTRNVELTPEGAMLLVQAQRAMASLNLGLRQIGESTSKTVGHVSFACAPSLAATILPDILVDFREKRPGIQLELHELDSARLLRFIQRRAVAFGIGPQVESESDFDFKEIVSEPIYALIPKPYWLPSMRKTIALKELINFPLILSSSSSSLRKTLDSYLSEEGLEIKNVMEVDQVGTMLPLAKAGLGIALVPGMMLPDNVGEYFQVLPIVQPQFMRTICLITLKGYALSPSALELTNAICSRLQDTCALKGEPRLAVLDSIDHNY